MKAIRIQKRQQNWIPFGKDSANPTFAKSMTSSNESEIKTLWGTKEERIQQIDTEKDKKALHILFEMMMKDTYTGNELLEVYDSIINKQYNHPLTTKGLKLENTKYIPPAKRENLHKHDIKPTYTPIRKEEKGCKIKIFDLPDVTLREVGSYFSCFGEIVHLKVLEQHSIAFITFKYPKSAVNAFNECNKKPFEGSIISIRIE